MFLCRNVLRYVPSKSSDSIDSRLGSFTFLVFIFLPELVSRMIEVVQERVSAAVGQILLKIFASRLSGWLHAPPFAQAESLYHWCSPRLELVLCEVPCICLYHMHLFRTLVWQAILKIDQEWSLLLQLDHFPTAEPFCAFELAFASVTAGWIHSCTKSASPHIVLLNNAGASNLLPLVNTRHRQLARSIRVRKALHHIFKVFLFVGQPNSETAAHQSGSPTAARCYDSLAMPHRHRSFRLAVGPDSIVKPIVRRDSSSRTATATSWRLIAIAAWIDWHLIV